MTHRREGRCERDTQREKGRWCTRANRIEQVTGSRVCSDVFKSIYMQQMLLTGAPSRFEICNRDELSSGAFNVGDSDGRSGTPCQSTEPLDNFKRKLCCEVDYEDVWMSATNLRIASTRSSRELDRASMSLWPRPSSVRNVCRFRARSASCCVAAR